jgi:hypothetical protein
VIITVALLVPRSTRVVLTILLLTLLLATGAVGAGSMTVPGTGRVNVLLTGMGGNPEPEGAGMAAMPVLEEAGNGTPLIVVLLDGVPVPIGSADISAEFDGRIPLDTVMKDPEADGTTTDLETDPVSLTRLLVDAPSAEETGSGLAVVMTGTLNVTSVGEAPQPVLQVATVVVMITVIVDGVKVTGRAVVMWVVAVEIPTIHQLRKKVDLQICTNL